MSKLFSEVGQVAETISELMAAFKSYVERPGNQEQDLTERMLTRVEDLFLVVVGLSQSQSITTSMILVLQYARTYTNKSFVLLIKKFFSSMRIDKGDGAGPQPIPKKTIKFSLRSAKKNGGPKEGGKKKMDDLIETFKGMSSKEKLYAVRASELTEFTRHAINALMVIGLCPEQADTVLGTTLYEFVGSKMSPKDSKMDFLESIFHCTDWVTASLLPAVARKDWSLLIGKDELMELNKNYAKAIDMVDLMMAGKMKRVREKYKIQLENDVLFFVEETAMAHSVYLSSMNKKKSSLHYETATKRVVTLNKLILDIHVTLKETPIRVKPFGLLIYGDTGVSKSTLVTIFNQQICFANNFKCDKNSVVYMNGDDAYQSEYRTFHVTFVFDDMANTMPERTVDNPLMKLIQFLNNMHIHALSPEADKKGKMQVLPKVGFVTTNKADLNASYYSVCPASVLRRFEYKITVTLKQQFIDPSTGMPFSDLATSSCPDMWNLTVTHIKIVRMGKGIPDVMREVIDLENVGVYVVNEFLKVKSVEHFRIQESLVATQTKIYEAKKCALHGYVEKDCPICSGSYTPEKECIFLPPVGRTIETFGTFTPKPEESGEEQAFIVDNVKKQASFASIKGSFSRFKASYVEPTMDMEGVLTDEGYVPDEVVNEFEPDVEDVTKFTPRERVRELCQQVIGDFERYKPDTSLTTAAGILASLTAFYFISRKVWDLTHRMEKQDERQKFEPYKASDQQNMWKRPVVTDTQYVEASMTTTFENFENKLWKNIARFKFHVSDTETSTVLGIPVGGNDWLLPRHALPPLGEEWLVEVSMERGHGAVGYKKFKEYVTRDNWCGLHNDTSHVEYEVSDLAVLRMTNTGSVKDFTSFIQQEIALPTIRTPLNSKIFYRDKDLVEHKWPCGAHLIEAPDYGCGNQQMGYGYSLPDTFPGLCGSPLVTNGKNPMILGLHTAGDASNAFAVLATQEMVNVAKSKLKKWNAHRAVPIPEQEYGVKYNLGENIHERNPIYFMDSSKQHNVEIYGQTTIPQVRFTSKVATSPISNLVTEEFSKPREHTRPPTHAEYMHYNRDLDSMVTQRTPPKASIMDRALKDMCDSFDIFLENNPEFAEAVGTLSIEQAINGIDGSAGIDKINMKASVSLPLRGKKSKYMKIVDSDEHEVAYDFDADLLDVRSRIAEMKEKLLAGERINTLFATCLKDEAIPFEKYDEHKVRTYSAAQVAFIILVRQYYLPLMAAKRRYPLHFESAVGTNAAGKDWRCFEESMRDKDRIFNGDYKKFDKGMHVEVTTATFEYYDHILERCGMSEHDRIIARGIATEICYPIYEIKSALFGVTGSNPSGQPLTVEVNNDGNRIYMRYAYYVLHPENVPLFNVLIDLVCYGDDNLGSVDPKETKFNHSSVAAVLSSIGVTYTMADKKSESIPFIKLSDADLLKRKFVFHESLGCVVGPIEEASILKSLHTWRTDSPLCEGEYMAGVLRQALDEYFLHGRDMYELRRPQVESIAARHHCNPPISDFLSLPSYEDLVERFNDTTSVMEEYSQDVPACRAIKYVMQSLLEVTIPDEDVLESDLHPNFPWEEVVCDPYHSDPMCLWQDRNWRVNYVEMVMAFANSMLLGVVMSWSFQKNLRITFPKRFDWFWWIWPFAHWKLFVLGPVWAWCVHNFFGFCFQVLADGANFHVQWPQRRRVRRIVPKKFSYVSSIHVRTTKNTPRKLRDDTMARRCEYLAECAEREYLFQNMRFAPFRADGLRMQAKHGRSISQEIAADIDACSRARRIMSIKKELDRRLICAEIELLSLNEGQVINVPCGSFTHGLEGIDRILEADATHERCKCMQRAWRILKVCNSPLLDIVPREVLFRIIAGVKLSFRAVSFGEFHVSGGFRSQIAKFREDGAVDSFPLGTA